MQFRMKITVFLFIFKKSIIDRKKKEVSDLTNTIDELRLQLSNAKVNFS